MAFMKGSPLPPPRTDQNFAGVRWFSSAKAGKSNRSTGDSAQEAADLRAARHQIRQLEEELPILKRASKWFEEEEGVDAKERTR